MKPNAADQPVSKPKALRGYPALDGLRCFGLFVIVFAHLPMVTDGGLYNTLWEINRSSRVGYLLLDSFFTLSGFLITRILLAEKVKTGSVNIRRFYTRRALRILPIYYLTLFACLLAFRMPRAEITGLATYTANFYYPFLIGPSPMEHTWSLSVEEQFYLVWPLLVMALPLRLGTLVTGRVLPLVAIIFGVAIALAVPRLDFAGDTDLLAGNFVYMAPFTRMLALSLGAWIAYRELERRPLPGWTMALMCVGALGVLAFDAVGRSSGLVSSHGLYWVIALVGYGPLSVALIGTYIFGQGVVSNALRFVSEWSPLRAIGRASYGGYLYHMPIFYWFGLRTAMVTGQTVPASQVALALAVTAAVTAASYRFIEAPIQAYRGKAVAPRPATAPAASATQAAGSSV